MRREDIGRRVAGLRGPRLYRSIREAALHQDPGGGLPIGLPEIDAVCKGLRPGKLNMFVGFSSHGKTQLALHMLLSNPDRRRLFVSMDDSDDIVILKLLAMTLRRDVDDVREMDPAERASIAERRFGRLLVAHPESGVPYSVDQLSFLWEAASQELGGPPELLVLDYLELLKLNWAEDKFTTVRKQVQSLQFFIRSHRSCVFVVIHQANRSGLAPGPLTMGKLAFGGEQETDGVMVGCRRDVANEMDETEMDAELHDPCMYVNILKNKSNGRLTHPMGIRYSIDPTCGAIMPITVRRLRSVRE